MGPLPGASGEAELFLSGFGCGGRWRFEGEAYLRFLGRERSGWFCGMGGEEEGGRTLEFFCGAERGGFGGR